jgi:hypothetical protein
VLAAAADGVLTFSAMGAIGVGGRRTGQALALRLGGGLVVLAGVLVALAA